MQDVSLIMHVEVRSRRLAMFHVGRYTSSGPIDVGALREMAVARLVATDDHFRGLSRAAIVVHKVIVTTPFTVLAQ